MPSRMLCNDIKREGANPSPGLVSGLSYYVPLHNIRYGIYCGSIHEYWYIVFLVQFASLKLTLSGHLITLFSHQRPEIVVVQKFE
jgi:hypothetical protein